MARLDSAEKKSKPVKACKFCTVSIESTTSDNTVAIVKKMFLSVIVINELQNNV